MSLVCVALGVASCSQDRDPKYQSPTSFVLNAPAMQDQYIELQKGNTLELVASQPDYGYSAVAEYSAEMSLTEDFAQTYALEPTEKTVARMNFPQEQIATGICELSGATSEDTYKEVFPNGQDFGKVYFRATCKLDGVEGSSITSNVVAYNYLKGYFAVPVPGYIYLVGAPEGWAGPTAANEAHYAEWRLFEPKDAIGSKVYSGVFDIEAGKAQFRFYTALTGWDADSYGSQTEDNPIQFPEFTGAAGASSFSSQVVKGKGSFEFPNWQGGKMTITVDMSDMKNITLTCQAGEASVVVTKYIYLVGSISGWKEPSSANEAAYKDFRLADTTGDGIYTGKFNVAAGDLSFRFALELNDQGWDNQTQIGAQKDDANVDCSFTNGAYSGPYVDGKGNWAFKLDKDGTVSLTVDTNQKTVSYVFE